MNDENQRIYYAIVDDKYVCVGIIDTFGEINQPNYIKIDKLNMDLIGEVVPHE